MHIISFGVKRERKKIEQRLGIQPTVVKEEKIIQRKISLQRAHYKFTKMGPWAIFQHLNAVLATYSSQAEPFVLLFTVHLWSLKNCFAFDTQSAP